MRTTIQLDDHLLSTVEQYARETGQTLTTVVEDALWEMLARRNKSVGRKPVKLTTVNGKGLVHSGIDLDDSKVLLDLMEDLSHSKLRSVTHLFCEKNDSSDLSKTIQNGIFIL